MRVLMVNHPRAEGFRGGDLVQMRQTAAALRAYGVSVTESFAPDPCPTGFDLAHVFNLRATHDTLTQVTHLKGFGIPVVMSPLYLDPGVALWGSRAVTGFVQDAPSPEVLAGRLASLRDRAVTVTLAEGGTYTADAPNRPAAGCDRTQRAVLGMVDLLLVNSLLEQHTLARVLRPAVAFAVAPVGLDPATFRNPDPARFRAKYGAAEFVHCVGRIESPKNQLLLAIACRALGHRLVLIGGCTHPAYLDAVRRYGPVDLLVLPHVEQAELRHAYAAARVHALPSWGETCGLVNLEAGLCGASVVAGTQGYEVEYLGECAEYADPADVQSVTDAVARAWEIHPTPAGGDRRDQLTCHILGQFTWAGAAAATHRVYRRVLSQNWVPRSPAPATVNENWTARAEP